MGNGLPGCGERLMEWYRDARRPLPWRADRDPYRILVSELMLVQTTVTAVIPYFERFLRQFPDIRSLAEADEAEVLKAWEGLGYYRRARQLQAAARQVVREHEGMIPDDPAAVRALPGVGRYIAGAVLSFAFDRPEPIVEANSQRVLARLLAVREDLKVSRVRERIWQAAERLVPELGAGDFNQALMDLGALVCTPRSAELPALPAGYASAGRARLGLQDSIPMTTPKPPPAAVNEACAVVSRKGQILIVQRGPGRTLGALLGVSDHPRRRRRPGRSVLRRPGRAGRGSPAADGDPGRGRLAVDHPSIQRHEPPGHAERPPGGGPLGYARPRPRPGQRPMGRARPLGRADIQLGRPPADCLDRDLVTIGGNCEIIVWVHPCSSPALERVGAMLRIARKRIEPAGGFPGGRSCASGRSARWG